MLQESATPILQRKVLQYSSNFTLLFYSHICSLSDLTHPILLFADFRSPYPKLIQSSASFHTQAFPQRYFTWMGKVLFFHVLCQFLAVILPANSTKIELVFLSFKSWRIYNLHSSRGSPKASNWYKWPFSLEDINVFLPRKYENGSISYWLQDLLLHWITVQIRLDHIKEKT